MLLDAVLADPALDWLTTTAEKVAYFTHAPCAVPIETLPRLRADADPLRVANAFPDRFPIGIGADGRALVLYLVRPLLRDDFRAFLLRHSALLQTLPSWTLRLVFPRAVADTYARFQTVVHEEFESPLHVHTAEELRWYFEQLRTGPNRRLRPTDERFLRAAEAFERPRFHALYRRWLNDRDGALEKVSSTRISDALSAGAGRVDCLILPHRYDHLAPVVDMAGAHVTGRATESEQSARHEPRRRPMTRRPAISSPVLSGI